MYYTPRPRKPVSTLCAKCKTNKKDPQGNRKRQPSYCKECNKAMVKESYPKYEERRKRSAREYYLKNQEKIQEYCRNNTEARRERNRTWRKNNPEKCLAQSRKSNADPIQRMNRNMRNSITRGLRGQKKKLKTFDYIGLKTEEFWDYLESKFQDGMTRENYGEWHVDHIRPLSSFDFASNGMEDQLKIAWHYTNLQPLWAIDNFKKGNKIEQ